VFSAAGDGAVRVPPGTYDVFVSRGPEWDVAVVRKLKVTPEGAELVARLHHVIDSRGWYSADFHVHAAPSPDSSVPLPHRIIEFIADGIDMLTSTDHNIVTDYAPTIKALGVGNLIGTIMGDEITTASWGISALSRCRKTSRGQARARCWPTAVPPKTFSTSAHPCAGRGHRRAPPAHRSDLRIFHHREFDPHSDRAGKKGFSFDFDAIEVLTATRIPPAAAWTGMIDDYLACSTTGIWPPPPETRTLIT